MKFSNVQGPDTQELWKTASKNGLQDILHSKFDDLLDKYFDPRDFIVMLTLQDQTVLASSGVTGDLVGSFDLSEKQFSFGDVRSAIADKRSCPTAAVKITSSNGEVLDQSDDGIVAEVLQQLESHN